MAIELQHGNIIIPIENINKCKSLGGFEKFIESQKNRLGVDVWYDKYLYRYRVPEYSQLDIILKFWENQGLQPLKQIDCDSNKSEWKDICYADESGPSKKCNWLAVNKNVPCVWLKGTPRGKLCGSIRRNSKVISETTIGPQYYENLFRNLNKLREAINLKFHNYLDKLGHFYTELTPPKFNINVFLDVFDLIKLNEGYTLDYEYSGDSPLVFTRNTDHKSDEVSSDDNGMKKAIGPFHFENIKDISFEQSPEGFFQFAVFSRVVHQFYLHWHANYNDEVFIFSKSQIAQKLKIIFQDRLKSMLRDLYIKKKYELPEDDVISRKAKEVWKKFCEQRTSLDDIPFYQKMNKEIKHTFISAYNEDPTQQINNLFNPDFPLDNFV